MIYGCCDERRRELVDAHPVLNGIDYLEVVDRSAPAGVAVQRTLLVRFLKPVPAALDRDNVVVAGGERIRDIEIEWAMSADDAALPAPLAPVVAGLDAPDHVLIVRTDQAGDFSTYSLRLARGPGDPLPPAGIDPRLAEVTFSFKVECPSDFDCARDCTCHDEPPDEPDLDYLAKDYASLRRLMLDRVRQLVPGWRPTTPADLGVTLVELLAFVGDQLSYEQDAVATEAYLHTARRRTSLRRHALLVDYRIGEGNNARTWVEVTVDANNVTMADDAVFLTRLPGTATVLAPGSNDAAAALGRTPVAFQPMHPATFHQRLNEMSLYTWGDVECCLNTGATEATLAGHFPELGRGSLLAFVEEVGPRTGVAGDADPAHRHVVRLIDVVAFTPGGASLTDPLTNAEITEVRWAADDALSFSLCASSILANGALIDDVSKAHGNLVLADHGLPHEQPGAGTVPHATLRFPPSSDGCDRSVPEDVPARFSVTLDRAPLTRQATVPGPDGVGRVPFDPTASAASALRMDPTTAEPDLAVTDAGAGIAWLPRLDLLDSAHDDEHLVVETEHDGAATLRFGDGTHGRRPAAGTTFDVDFRVGNGPEGNIGADALHHAITATTNITAVRNIVPATGGIAPEAAAQIRRRAPEAFRRQERAVTPADYAEVTERLDGIQRASASLRWTGSWHTVSVTVDRAGGADLDDEFTTSVRRHLDRYRMAGHDIRLQTPTHVSLELALHVCVNAAYFRADVRRGLQAGLGSGVMADGRNGVFHPDNLTFGQAVYLSSVYAEASRVPGIDSVEVTAFHRQGTPDDRPLTTGVFDIGPQEIARLANDPNFPEHGVVRLTLHGGK